MDPPETSEFLMLYNDDRVKTVTYVGDGSFSESENEDIIVLAEPRPIVFEEEEDVSGLLHYFWAFLKSFTNMQQYHLG